MNKTRYSSTNDAAKKFILPEVLKNPVIYPPESVWAKMEWLKDIKEAQSLYERAWKEVKLRK